MCIGIPMRVVEREGSFAICEGRGETRRLNMMLLGETCPGSWVLAHLDWAREELDEIRAAQINEALDLLDAVMNGKPVDSLAISDTEPQLPDFLRGNIP